MGASDVSPDGSLPTLEDWVEDICAVLDDVGFDRVAVLGPGPGCSIAVMFAAKHPARQSALMLVNGTHHRTAGMTFEEKEGLIALVAGAWVK